MSARFWHPVRLFAYSIYYICKTTTNIAQTGKPVGNETLIISLENLNFGPRKCKQAPHIYNYNKRKYKIPTQSETYKKGIMERMSGNKSLQSLQHQLTGFTLENI